MLKEPDHSSEPKRGGGVGRLDHSGESKRGGGAGRLDHSSEPKRGVGAGKLVQGGVPDQLDLGAIERKTYASYHQDGLADLLAGLLVLCGGWALLSSNGGVLAIMPVLALPLLEAARRKVRYPRVGYFVYAPRAQRAGARFMTLLLVISLVFLVLGLVMLLLHRLTGYVLPTQAQPFSGWTISVAAALGLASVGLATFQWRWYAYAALATAAAGVAQLIGQPALGGLALSGIGIIASGAGVLLLFLRRHPVLSGDAPGGNSVGGAA